MNESVKPLRPLWREPIMIGIVAVVIALCLGLWFQDRLVHRGGGETDPDNKAALPAGGAGGGFCDLPVPVQSTPVKPTTQKTP
jgi:hypothetical protein